MELDIIILSEIDHTQKPNKYQLYTQEKNLGVK
jgi:hypothetical protein